MNNTAWNAGDDGASAITPAAPPRTRRGPRYSVVLALCGAPHAEDLIRNIVRRHRGDLAWLSGNQPRHATRAYMRLHAERIYDIVTAFEAAGFDVVRVVTTGR